MNQHNESARRVYLQDVTLRDGMHAVRHQLSPEKVAEIAGALDRAGVDAIEVSHGDGLSGGSLTYGPGSNTDWEWIEAAASAIKTARLTTLLIPGIGTLSALRQAYALGVRSVRGACDFSDFLRCELVADGVHSVAERDVLEVDPSR